MSYATIRRVRAVLQSEGLAAAVSLAQSYGVLTPGEFVLWFIAEPGQHVRIR